MLLRVVGFLLRLYSYLFHLILSLFLLALPILAGTSHQPLHLGMLPFPQDELSRDVYLLGAAGLVCTIFAFTRSFKFLFPLWAGYVVYLMVSGFLFSPYRFAGAAEFKESLWLILASIGAFVGAFWVLMVRRGRRHL